MNIQQFTASAGWLDRFKNRYGLKNLNLHGEMGDVDFAAISEEKLVCFFVAFPNTRIYWETKRKAKSEGQRKW